MPQSNLVYHKETLYFILCLVISILIYLAAAVTIIGFILIAAFILISLIANAFFIGTIRGNGVRLSNEQFPDVYERIEKLSAEMGIKRVPDVFIVQSEGRLNAFATRFFGRNMVILYSEVFDLARQQGEKELEFIIAHELAHVKRRHILKHWLILPAMWMPFLGEAYMRAAEYTCDRYAIAFIQDGYAAKNALKILAVGKRVYPELNEDAYLRQINEESNPFVWIAEKLSSHPNLPKRIQQVGHFSGMKDTPNYSPNGGKMVAGVMATFVGLALIGGGAVAGFTYVVGKVDVGSLLESDEVFIDDLDETELMSAAWNGDLLTMEELLASGVDVNETDVEGSTALHYAIYGGSFDSVAQLLAERADPNLEDDMGVLPLILAYELDKTEIAMILLDYGADPDQEPYNGVSARGLAAEYGNNMYLRIFEDY